MVEFIETVGLCSGKKHLCCLVILGLCQVLLGFDHHLGVGGTRAAPDTAHLPSPDALTPSERSPRAARRAERGWALTCGNSALGEPLLLHGGVFSALSQDWRGGPRRSSPSPLRSPAKGLCLASLAAPQDSTSPGIPSLQGRWALSPASWAPVRRGAPPSGPQSRMLGPSLSSFSSQLFPVEGSAGPCCAILARTVAQKVLRDQKLGSYNRQRSL